MLTAYPEDVAPTPDVDAADAISFSDLLLALTQENVATPHICEADLDDLD